MVDESVNNTSVNIPLKIIDKIKIPFYFFALGIDSGMGINKKGIKKFTNWIDHVSKKPNFYLSFRNGGSHETIFRYFKQGFEKKFIHLLDGGFLVNHLELLNDNNKKYEQRYLGINLAGDMLDKRFPENFNYEDFISIFTLKLSDFLKKNSDFKVLLIPHIFSDQKVIYDVLNKIEDYYRRERIDVSELYQGNLGMIKTVKNYSDCEIILGNRFHSNIIGLVLRKKVLGLYNYKQIKFLFKEFHLDNFFDVRNKKGIKSLFNKLDETIINKNSNKLDDEIILRNKKMTIYFFKDLINKSNIKYVTLP